MPEKKCGSCAWRPNGWQTARSEYCYKWDEFKAPDNTCDEWRKSLRDEPVNLPPAHNAVSGPVGVNVARLLGIELPPIQSHDEPQKEET